MAMYKNHFFYVVHDKDTWILKIPSLNIEKDLNISFFDYDTLEKALKQIL